MTAAEFRRISDTRFVFEVQPLSHEDDRQLRWFIGAAQSMHDEAKRARRAEVQLQVALIIAVLAAVWAVLG